MKYMGSKSRIAKYIVPILQECIDSNHVTTYIEPFVGGGNIIDKIRCQERIGSDINPYLIALLKRVQEGKPLLDEVSRDTYNLVREAWKNGTDKDKYEQWYVGNVGFLAMEFLILRRIKCVMYAKTCLANPLVLMLSIHQLWQSVISVVTN